MADKKTVAGKIAKEALDVIYKSPQGQKIMNQIVLSIADPKVDVRLKDVGAGYMAVQKAHDLYTKGMGSKVTTQLANKVMDEFNVLPPEVQGKLTGTFEQLGAKGSMRVGPQGRAGLVLPNFNDPSSIRAFYEDDKTRVDVNRNRVSARYKFKAGPLDMYARGAVRKGGYEGKGGYEVGVGGEMKFAKGGKVKKYAKGGGVRKPKLK